MFRSLVLAIFRVSSLIGLFERSRLPLLLDALLFPPKPTVAVSTAGLLKPVGVVLVLPEIPKSEPDGPVGIFLFGRDIVEKTEKQCTQCATSSADGSDERVRRVALYPQRLCNGELPGNRRAERESVTEGRGAISANENCIAEVTGYGEVSFSVRCDSRFFLLPAASRAIFSVTLTRRIRATFLGALHISSRRTLKIRRRHFAPTLYFRLIFVVVTLLARCIKVLHSKLAQTQWHQ